MVALFAGLKLRLIRNRAMNHGDLGVLWLVLGVLAAIAAGGLVGLGFAILRTSPDSAPLGLASFFFSLLLAWMVMPLVAFGVDETVDPRRFALLPIPAGRLQRGLLASSLVGYLPLANAIALTGAAIGLSPKWSMLPVALVCVIGVLLMCVIGSRALAASMASLMGSRRGRDLGMAVTFVLFIIYFLLSGAAGGARGSFADPLAGAIGRVLGWTPPGGLAVIPSDLDACRWLPAAARAVIAGAFLVALWVWWGRALRTSLTTIGSTTESSAVSRGLIDDDAVATDTRSTAQLMFGRDLTMIWRDPMRRLPLLMVGLLAVGWPFLTTGSERSGYAVAFAAAMAGMQAATSYATEGSGLWLHLTAFADRARARGELWGHAVAAVVPGLVISVIGVLIQVIVRDGWSHLPGMLGLCFGAVLTSTAAALFVSACLPYAVPQSRTSMFASRVPGQGGRAFAASLATMAGGALLCIPIIVLVVLGETVDSGFAWAALVLGPLYGLVLLWFSVRLSAGRYLATAPEILQTVSAGDWV
ncbi:MAG: hypothetical protein V9G19_09305 [Tetrasphaera sp.]